MKISNQFFKYLVLGFLVTNFYACKEGAFEQVVEIDIPEHEPKIALSMEINQGDEQLNTFVSRSSSINDIIETPILEDITINVFKNETMLTEMVFDSTTRAYLANVDPIPNDEATYRIEVISPEFGTATAEQTMPSQVSISNLEYEEDGTIDSYGERVNELSFMIDDPEAERNYYSIKLFSFFKYIQDTSTLQIQNIYPYSLDPLLEYAQNGELILSDDSFNGTDHRVTLNIEKYYLEVQDKEELVLFVEFKNISRDNYLYKRTLDIYWSSVDNPFAEPVVVHNNIENGFGIFRTAAVYTEEIKIK